MRPKNSKVFHVYRATNAIKLNFNDGLNIFDEKFNDIDINYYVSTTIRKDSIIFGEYTDTMYPILMDIEIPVGAQVLALGNPFGQMAQQEVLLNRGSKLRYVGQHYALIRNSNDIPTKNKLYALVLKFEYSDPCTCKK